MDDGNIVMERSPSRLTGRNIVTNVETERKTTGKTDLHECVKCEKLFSRKSMFQRHERNCNYNRCERRGDAI